MPSRELEEFLAAVRGNCLFRTGRECGLMEAGAGTLRCRERISCSVPLLVAKCGTRLFFAGQSRIRFEQLAPGADVCQARFLQQYASLVEAAAGLIPIALPIEGQRMIERETAGCVGPSVVPLRKDRHSL